MLLHLAWRNNLDGYDMALAVNRLAAQGAPLWWLGTPGPSHEPGDYICEATGEAADRLARFGIFAERWAGPLPPGAIALAYPRIALFAGHASAYPNFAYYAIALLRLGFAFELVDGAAIAGGGLQECDLLILPAGCALWGLDAAEGVEGVDAAVRAFLAERRAAVASGGGAFYLSSGRPGWTGTAPVRPQYTHEYLRTGVGIVSVRLGADSIGFGCPPTLAMPYYHGPVYDVLDQSVFSAGSFDELLMPGHLFIANPLDAEIFARTMRGHAAILRVEGRRGRAVMFSGNPEMGELIRKYIAFDGYVARYLPIAGETAMADVLRHYRILDAPSFRVILNAVHSLMLRRGPQPVFPVERVAAGGEPTPRLAAILASALARLAVAGGDARAGLAEMLRRDLDERLVQIVPRAEAARTALQPLPGPAQRIRAVVAECEREAVAALTAQADAAWSIAERLAEIETALSLIEAWCRLAEAESHFAGSC